MKLLGDVYHSVYGNATIHKINIPPNTGCLFEKKNKNKNKNLYLIPLWKSKVREHVCEKITKREQGRQEK